MHEGVGVDTLVTACLFSVISKYTDREFVIAVVSAEIVVFYYIIFTTTLGSSFS